jgi:hypothetical protein
LNPSEFEAAKAQALLVKDRIVERHRQLRGQLSQSQLPFLEFTNGVRLITEWIKTDVPPSGQMDQATGPNGLACLHIFTASEASPSWRAKAQLKGGHYRFEAKVRVSGAKPLSFGTHQGAGLRIGGQSRQSEDLTGDSDWRLLAERFEVDSPGAEVEFICELRANCGEVWFDCASLRVVKEP